MKDNFYCLAIIPARGGSKRVQGKNIKLLNGNPLISYSIEAALKVRKIDRVIVSTDDQYVADISLELGADVPFIRPTEFAQDDTPDILVYEHAISWFSQVEGFIPDIVVWLRPTSPLRKPKDVELSIDLLIESKADCVRTVCAVQHHPYWMMKFDDNRLIPFIDGIDIMKDYYQRQLLPPVYRLNGAVDISRPSIVVSTDSLYSGVMRGYVMPHDRSIDIDSEIDFIIAEALMKRNLHE